MADVEWKGETKIQKTKIEWADYSVNPVKGYCPVGCEYCYARRMYDRFKWDKTIRFDFNALHTFGKFKSGSRVFVGSTIELFHPEVMGKVEFRTSLIIEEAGFYPDVSFIFLTKCPQNLHKFSPWPKNCWVGVSVCNDKMLDIAVDKLEDIEAGTKFISFEPLLERLTLSLAYAFYYSGISWLIIGAATHYKDAPPLSKVQGWAREIIAAADEAGIPVFCKDNLKLPANEIRREWPKP